MYIYGSISLNSSQIRNVSEKHCRENQNIVLCSIIFPKIVPFMRCVTNTKRIVTFPLQQWLRERVILLRYAYIACLVTHHSVFFSSAMNYLF
jgi:hypothetical protein